jgi:o-succinylbenzoate---CoA ligase
MSLPPNDPTAIPHPLASAALDRPHHVALRAEGRAWTAAELLEAVRRRAGALAGLGIRAGDTVGLTGAPSVRWVITFHALGWIGATVAPLAGTDDVELSRDRVVDAHSGRFDGAALAERFWPLDEARLLLHTSGSTGAPQPVCLSTLQLLLSAFGSALRLEHRRDDVWLACLPLHHIGGLSVLLRCAWYGTTAQLMERFDAPAVAALLDSGSITQVSLVPSLLTRVLDARQEAPFPTALRLILVGGAAADQRLLERGERLALPLVETWGMTEAASQIATCALAADRPGRLAPLAFARVNMNGDRLRVCGPLIHGSVTTSDLGRIEADGGIRVTGRADGAINRGGEKIHPAEVEAVLCDHPAVAEAVVLGLPDTRLGERVVAAVVGGPSEPYDDAALLRWCKARLEAHKVPTQFTRLDALPRTELGKVQRAKVRLQLQDIGLGYGADEEVSP